ncbi:MAG: outer membrane beta-barrel protein [Paludibacteraceae bacterium]
MKKIFLIALISISTINIGFGQNTTAEYSKQLWKNFHFGWDVDSGDGYRWSNFGIGTGIARNVEILPKVYWYVGGDLNWSKYTLYKGGQYNNTGNNYYIKTFSLSIPALAGYRIYESPLSAFGVKVYTGPLLETIFSGKRDGFDYKNYNALQFGWTVGAGVKLYYAFGFNLAYRYYPTPLLSDGNLVRSSINFTFGF